MYVKVVTYNIHSGAIQWQIPDFLLMGIVMFDLSLTVYEIFANKENALTLKLKVWVEEKNWTCAIRQATFQSNSTYTYANSHTNTHLYTNLHTHTHTARDRSDDCRQNLLSRFSKNQFFNSAAIRLRRNLSNIYCKHNILYPY